MLQIRTMKRVRFITFCCWIKKQAPPFCTLPTCSTGPPYRPWSRTNHPSVLFQWLPYDEWYDNCHNWLDWRWHWHFPPNTCQCQHGTIGRNILVSKVHHDLVGHIPGSNHSHYHHHHGCCCCHHQILILPVVVWKELMERCVCVNVSW